MNKDRIIHLQKQVRIARLALEAVQRGEGDPYEAATTALDELFKLDQKQPLQGLVGHERRSA